MKFEVAAGSDTGQVRRGNEDAAVAIQSESRDAVLLVVADGVGGLAAGAHASNLAVDRAVEAFRGCEGDPVDCLDASFRETSAMLYDEAGGDEARLSGTTVVALLLEPGRATVLHAGDSRAYRIHEGALELLTRDHSWVNEQVDAGLMSQDEAEVAPQRNIITRCLGVEPGVEIERAELPPPAPGECYLLSSDGFHGVVPRAEVEKLLRSGKSVEEIAKQCIDVANRLGGPDNISVALARIG
ncbi:MAG: protein phosphatase 2C domain-containing protein [Dehalococcoidia bacterium]|nr:protein phosphatase 2C domain-containing protein [Dehalococcoidia bacterium]